MIFIRPPLRVRVSGPHPVATLSAQRGVALFVVIVFVLLSSLLSLWASRTSLFSEMVVSNDADYQRAFEAAQALLQDAEMDIRSAEPDKTNKTLDGINCSAGGDICRIGLSDYQIPGSKENEKVGLLIAQLATHSADAGCHKGLCVKRSGAQDFWNDTAMLALMAKDNVGARYGQFTGSAKGSNSEPANPILSDVSSPQRGGWYWIEVLPYIKPGVGTEGRLLENTTTGSGGGASILKPNLDPNVIYRVTAIAYGRKPSTMVVLQETYAQQRRKD